MEIKKYTVEGEDDMEVILAMNEILNVLKFNMNTSAIYWYHWLDKLSQMKKKDKQIITCKSRKITQIKDTYWKDWVWVLWNILLEHSQRVGIDKHIRVLYYIYKYNFNVTTRKTKHVIVSTAILMLKYHVNQQLNWKTPVIRTYYIYLQAVGNINQLYRDVNEKLPKNFNEQHVYQEMKGIRMPSEQFKKYLVKFQKEFSEEARQSNYKTKMFTEIVTYKDDPYKTSDSITQAHHSIQKPISKAVDYNLIKKTKKYQPPTKEPSILEHYQQPNTKSTFEKDFIFEEPGSKYKSRNKGNKIIENDNTQSSGGNDNKSEFLISEIPHIPRKKPPPHQQCYEQSYSDTSPTSVHEAVLQMDNLQSLEYQNQSQQLGLEVEKESEIKEIVF